MRLLKKILNDNDQIYKNANLAILGHFWPVFGLLRPLYQCPKLSMSLFDLVLNGLSEINKKIVNNNDLFIENADFGHYRLFLACYDPRISG